jgi:hypothetical protein
MCEVGYQQREQEYCGQESEPEQKALNGYFRISLPWRLMARPPNGHGDFSDVVGGPDMG